MTNNDKQVGNPDDLNGGTYGLAVSNECFVATSKKLVRTKTDERAVAAGGATWQAK